MEKSISFRNRLVKVYRHRVKTARRLHLDCWRVYDHDLPEFPFSIDFYGTHLYISEYRRRHGMDEAEHEQWLQSSLSIISEVLDVPGERIHMRLRQRKPGRQGQYEKEEDQGFNLIVKENGLSFHVNLGAYLDTGLFPDHRITREMVRAASSGKKVLNLFCYTGAFSVYAAAGGASEVVSIDLSRTYLNWAERNMNENGFTDTGKYKFVQADVLQYLHQLPSAYFDIVVLDPPTFSNSKRMKDFLDVQRDHPRLINGCIAAMRKGGQLYFSTNFTKFQLEAEQLNCSDITDITRQTIPFDFEGKLMRKCFLLKV